MQPQPSARHPMPTLLAGLIPNQLTTVNSLSHLIPILQLAVGPVILISGVGMLLLTLTNRFGRVIDRTRALHRDRTTLPQSAHRGLSEQIAIMQRRASILRLAIMLAGGTALLVAVMILTLFVAALAALEVGPFIITLFCASLLTLIGAILAFLHDMNLSLRAIRLELTP